MTDHDALVLRVIEDKIRIVGDGNVLESLESVGVENRNGGVLSVGGETTVQRWNDGNSVYARRVLNLAKYASRSGVQNIHLRSMRNIEAVRGPIEYDVVESTTARNRKLFRQLETRSVRSHRKRRQ